MNNLGIKNSIDPMNEFLYYIKKYKFLFIFSLVAATISAYTFRSFQSPTFDVSAYLPINNNHYRNIFSTGTDTVKFNNVSNTDMKVAIAKLRLLILSQNIAGLTEKEKDEFIENVLLSTTGFPPVIKINVISSEPIKAKIFVEEISTKYLTVLSNKYNPDSVTTRISAINEEINKLKLKSIRLQNTLKNFKSGNFNADDKKSKEKQQDILNTILPYLNNSDHQFQQIPTTFNIEDAKINELINKFNSAESEKQSQLSRKIPGINPVVFNTRIIAIQNILHQLIDSSKRTLSIAKLGANDYSNLKDSIMINNRIIDSRIQLYEKLTLKKNSLFKNKSIHPTASVVPFKVIITRETSSSYVYYLIVLLISILFPLAYIVFFNEEKDNKENQKETVSQSPILGRFYDNENDEANVVDEIQKISILTLNKKILITGFKNNFQQNLIIKKIAFNLSKGNSKIVIIDFNLTKKTDKYSEIEGVLPGLTNYIFGNIKNVDQVIVSSIYKNVKLIKPGSMTGFTDHAIHEGKNFSIPLSSAGDIKDLIFNSSKFTMLLSLLEQKFEYIIFDGIESKNFHTEFLVLARISSLNIVILEENKKFQKNFENLNALNRKFKIQNCYIVVAKNTL